MHIMSQALGSHAPIVPTKILGDPEELDRYLLHSGTTDTHGNSIRRSTGDASYDNGNVYGLDSELDLHVSIACYLLLKNYIHF